MTAAAGLPWGAGRRGGPRRPVTHGRAQVGEPSGGIGSLPHTMHHDSATAVDDGRKSSNVSAARHVAPMQNYALTWTDPRRPPARIRRRPRPAQRRRRQDRTREDRLHRRGDRARPARPTAGAAGVKHAIRQPRLMWSVRSPSPSRWTSCRLLLPPHGRSPAGADRCQPHLDVVADGIQTLARTGQERRLEAVCADAVPRFIPTLVDLVPCCSSGEYLDPPRCTTRLSCLHVVSTALGPDHAAEAGAGCGEVVLKQR